MRSNTAIATFRCVTDGTIKAVLGPTNTGKTHLAIERMCGHSSGAIGFPLRLLAREVYDRVVAIKGEAQVALITGEERIEPPRARYFCCTAEAMPRAAGEHAFVALDEAQLSADRERGHVFTDRLLHARGREETMLLGAATLAPMVRQLVPEAEITERPRFSTLKHIGARKLSRLPPRSAVVAFAVEQVYAMAEMLRRLRGGAAVVMGALSPQTRNRQVELFQSGEVDYIVATDAIGMGLNLDVRHVAFASLSKFDGARQRRLLPAEMAQIAGRAGRHQTDGTFGTLSGQHAATELTEEEVFAVEEHRFAPLTRLYWREPQPRFDDLSTLIADLERPPEREGLVRAPETIDLSVLRILAERPESLALTSAGQVRRFWEACSLPDFRQQGADGHARFVARLWQDLRAGFLGADYVAARIVELDSVQGGIDVLQGRIAAIRSWAYICQRPDWVLARDEMASRAREVEARLSDALHASLTERFVNRRTTVLMRSAGRGAGALPVRLDEDDSVLVEDEAIGRLQGFRFEVDASAPHADRKLLLAAGEKALPRLLALRSRALIESGLSGVELAQGFLVWKEQTLAQVDAGADALAPKLIPGRELRVLPHASRDELLEALQLWLEKKLRALEPLGKLAGAANDPATGSHARAVLQALIAGHGYADRERSSLQHLPRELRPVLRRAGVHFGALDIFVPALLKPRPRSLLHALGLDPRPEAPDMPPAVAAPGPIPAGYRHAGKQAIRVDVAEKILRAAHEKRQRCDSRRFHICPELAISTGLTLASFEKLLAQAGFRKIAERAAAPGTAGPPLPARWEWRPPRRPQGRRSRRQQDGSGAFAALAELVR